MKQVNEMTAEQYAEAVGGEMSIPEASERMDIALHEAEYNRMLEGCRIGTRLNLELALLAYINGQPLPKMGHRIKAKFNKYVKPYGDLLKGKMNVL